MNNSTDEHKEFRVIPVDEPLDVLHHHRQNLASGAIVIAQIRKIRFQRPFHGRAGGEAVGY